LIESLKKLLGSQIFIKGSDHLRLKKFLVVALSSLLIFSSFPFTAVANDKSEQESSGTFSTKDEVIYGKLNANGTTENMYIVNSFQIDEPGKITDYGNYTNIRNLTDLSTIDQVGDEVHFYAEEETFYYQGELENKRLPWDISITYLLNGNEIDPDDLAGQSGDLEIQLTTAANENIDPVFFEHYLLQISLEFDPLIFRDIQAPKGTEANEGKNKLVTFTVMPDQEEVLIVSAHVDDLKMEPINISAIPANLAIEDPDIGNMKDDMKTLADAIRDIHSGVTELSDGISELNDGSSELSKGSSEYSNGINELDNSSSELISGSEEILNVLQQVSRTLDASPDLSEIDIEEIKALPKALRDIANNLQEASNYFAQLNKAIEQIPNDTITDGEIKNLQAVIDEHGANSNVFNQLVQMYYAAQAIRDMNVDVPDQLATLLKETANYLEVIANEIENNMDNLEQLEDLEALQVGLTTLSSEYQSFHNGLIGYTDGVHALTTNYAELDNGIGEISKGISALDRGVAELQDGTQELQDATSDLPDEMESEIEQFMEEYDFSDFEPTSFSSSQNENIGVVQFVLRTEKIEVEETETTEEEAEEKKGFWSRFLDLFR